MARCGELLSCELAFERKRKSPAVGLENSLFSALPSCIFFFAILIKNIYVDPLLESYLELKTVMQRC